MVFSVARSASQAGPCAFVAHCGLKMCLYTFYTFYTSRQLPGLFAFFAWLFHAVSLCFSLVTAMFQKRHCSLKAALVLEVWQQLGQLPQQLLEAWAA